MRAERWFATNQPTASGQADAADANRGYSSVQEGLPQTIFISLRRRPGCTDTPSLGMMMAVKNWRSLFRMAGTFS